MRRVALCPCIPLHWPSLGWGCRRNERFHPANCPAVGALWGGSGNLYTRHQIFRDPIEEEEPGVRVRHVLAGPFGGLTKYDLPQELCSFAHGVMQVEARHEPGYFDLIHSHYWLSGQVGLLAAPRWRVPLVHTFHTVAAVKNATLAAGDTPEPQERLEAEAV